MKKCLLECFFLEWSAESPFLLKIQMKYVLVALILARVEKSYFQCGTQTKRGAHLSSRGKEEM